MNNLFSNIFSDFHILYIILPILFLFAILPLKNHLLIRRITYVAIFIQMLLSVFLLCGKSSFEFLNINFYVTNNSLIYLALVSLIFAIFVKISKFYVEKAHKIFYIALLAIYFLISTFILIDNILFAFLIIFWFILAKYLLSVISSKDSETKKSARSVCKIELLTFFVAISLIGYDFLRFFNVNDIIFSFSNISSNLPKIDNFSISLSFVGFVILILSHFNFLAFFKKYSSLYKKQNLYIDLILLFSNSIIAIFLLYKLFMGYDMIFYIYQIPFAIFFTLSLLYFGFLSFRSDDISSIFLSIYIVNVSFGLTSLFVAKQFDLSLFSFYFLIFILSFALLYILFAFLEKEFKTKKIDEFLKIADNTKLTQNYTLFTLLLISKAPVSAFSFVSFLILMSVFSLNYNCVWLNLLCFVLIISGLFVILAILNIIYKLLLEPHQSSDKRILLPSCQKNIMFLLSLVLVLLIFVSIYIFKGFLF